MRLHIYQRDLAAAAEALREPTVMHAAPGGMSAPLADSEAATCPRCGSTEVAYDAAAKPGAAHWFVALLSRLRRYPLQGRANHCFHCGLNF